MDVGRSSPRDNPLWVSGRYEFDSDLFLVLPLATDPLSKPDHIQHVGVDLNPSHEVGNSLQK